MRSLLLLAVLASSPLSPATGPESSGPAFNEVERWKTFDANPAWEMYGRLESDGVFRYTAMRRKDRANAWGASVLNLGVNLPPLTAATAERDIRGTDADAAALVLQAALNEKVCAHSDCDGGRCDRRDREKDKEREREKEELKDWADWLKGNIDAEKVAAAALGVVLVIVLGIVAFAVLALFARGIMYLIRRT